MDAPRHDWKLYEERCRGPHVEWLRGLSAPAAIVLYESFHRLATTVNPGAMASRELDGPRWKEKVELRTRLRSAFVALDRAQRG